MPGDNVIVGDLFACGPDADSLVFPDFTSTIGLTLSGDAQDLGNGTIEMIPAGANTAGAVWTKERKAVRRGFTATFTFTLDKGVEDEFGEHAGFAFVLQSASPTYTDPSEFIVIHRWQFYSCSSRAWSLCVLCALCG